MIVETRVRGEGGGQFAQTSRRLILIGAALWQVLRRQVFPEAITLIWYALGVASSGSQRPRTGREAPTGEQPVYEEVDSSVE